MIFIPVIRLMSTEPDKTKDIREDNEMLQKKKNQK